MFHPSFQKKFMKHKTIQISLAAAVMLLSASLCLAEDSEAVAPTPAASQTKARAKAARSEADAKRQAAAQIKLVDINSASSAELKKLPGIGDAEAAKIIAGRPYGSKAWLVSNKVLEELQYFGIKDLIIAKQPHKDGARNAAPYAPKPNQ